MHLFGMGPFDAVVFDCDGVLVDSEPLSFAAWRRALAEFGHHMTFDEFHRFVGSTDRAVAEHYGPVLGVAPEALEEANATSVAATLAEDGLEPFADTVALLDRLEGAVGLGVGSNSSRWRLDALLGAAGLASRFGVSVTGDEVTRPKPAPDVYRTAIQGLGARPGSSLVIEDSPTGIQGARAAGAAVVAVDRGMFARADLAQADAVVDALM